MWAVGYGNYFYLPQMYMELKYQMEWTQIFQTRVIYSCYVAKGHLSSLWGQIECLMLIFNLIFLFFFDAKEIIKMSNISTKAWNQLWLCLCICLWLCLYLCLWLCVSLSVSVTSSWLWFYLCLWLCLWKCAEDVYSLTSAIYD